MKLALMTQALWTRWLILMEKRGRRWADLSPHEQVDRLRVGVARGCQGHCVQHLGTREQSLAEGHKYFTMWVLCACLLERCHHRKHPLSKSARPSARPWWLLRRCSGISAQRSCTAFRLRCWQRLTVKALTHVTSLSMQESYGSGLQGLAYYSVESFSGPRLQNHGLET